jgi:hypothetical protein
MQASLELLLPCCAPEHLLVIAGQARQEVLLHQTVRQAIKCHSWVTTVAA